MSSMNGGWDYDDLYGPEAVRRLRARLAAVSEECEDWRKAHDEMARLVEVWEQEAGKLGVERDRLQVLYDKVQNLRDSASVYTREVTAERDALKAEVAKVCEERDHWKRVAAAFETGIGGLRLREALEEARYALREASTWEDDLWSTAAKRIDAALTPPEEPDASGLLHQPCHTDPGPSKPARSTRSPATPHKEEP